MKIKHAISMKLVRYEFTGVDRKDSKAPIIQGTISVLINQWYDAKGQDARKVAQAALGQYDIEAPIVMIRPETIIDYEFNPEQVIRDAEFAGKFVP